MKNKKLKIAASIISLGILINPVSTLINNSNIANAQNNTQQNTKNNKINKHINYIDTQIKIINNKFIINEVNVKKYIEKNWDQIKLSTKLKTSKEYYETVISGINELNSKLETNNYEITNNKGITKKYKTVIGGSYYSNSYWWGEEYLTYNSTQKAELSRDLAISAAIISAGSGIPIIGPGFGISAALYGIMAARVGGFWSDRLKLKIFRTALYHTIDAI